MISIDALVTLVWRKFVQSGVCQSSIDVTPFQTRSMIASLPMFFARKPSGGTGIVGQNKAQSFYCELFRSKRRSFKVCHPEILSPD